MWPVLVKTETLSGGWTRYTWAIAPARRVTVTTGPYGAALEHPDGIAATVIAALMERTAEDGRT
jgi:hypothetical protein